MARELPTNRRSVSPESSGRDSPIPRQWRNQLGAEQPLSKDKAYRKYASGIDRALSLFETALQEWADYISFLNRLLKALQARQPQITSIPNKAIVTKRLAQCLDPTLPSGVHQKALEVYGHVFSIIGSDGLSKDLPLYLPGLAPTLSFASLSARAHFFDLLERYFLDIDPRSMRPALKALILALLPGLEDETAEDFDRTLKLLNRFKVAVRPSPGSDSQDSSSGQDLTPDHSSGDAFFWQCFFLATITSHSRRPGALAYLVRYLPKLGQPWTSSTSGGQGKNGTHAAAAPTDAARMAKLSQLVVSPEPGLLIRCFAAGLADEQLLIQRGFLDLLVSNLPLHSSVLQTRVKPADLELLIRAACGVVTRREMSLNRRLTAWLLGPDPPAADMDSMLESPTSVTNTAGDRQHHPAHKTSYFEEYGLQPLTRALLAMVQSTASSTPAERARPYRICLSLMDRWEIGGLVVPEVFLPIVDSVRRYKDDAPTRADFHEVLRSASVFFDGVESGLIYGEMLGLVAQAVGPGGGSSQALLPDERADKLALVRFVLSHFNVREEEMITIHAPLSALSILCMLEEIRERHGGFANETGDDDSNVRENATEALGIAAELLDLVPERAFPREEELDGDDKDDKNDGKRLKKKGSRREQTETLTNSEILKTIRTFYVHDQGNLDTAAPPLDPRTVAELLLQRASNSSCQALRRSSRTVHHNDLIQGELSLNSQVLLLLLDKIPPQIRFDVSPLLSALHDCLSSSISPSSSPSRRTTFSTFSAVLSLAVHLHLNERISTADLSAMVPPLVRLAWTFLSAAEPQFHVETVRKLWLLQTALGIENRDIEAAISLLILQDDVVHGSFSSRSADPGGRSFGVLWLHSLQDTPHMADRRTPKTPRTPNGNLRSFPRLAGVDHYALMLTRPVLLVLDALHDERTQLFMTVKAWLTSMIGIDRLFCILLSKFLSLRFVSHGGRQRRMSVSVPALINGNPANSRNSPGRIDNGHEDDDDDDTDINDDDDLDMCLYYLRTLSNVFRWAPVTMWTVLARRTLTDELRVAASALVPSVDDVSFQEMLVHVCMKCILSSGVSGRKGDSRSMQLCRYALTVLHQILLNEHAGLLANLHLEEAILGRLQQSLQGPDPYIQVLLLDVLFASLKIREALPSDRPMTALSESKAEDPFHTSSRLAALATSPTTDEATGSAVSLATTVATSTPTTASAAAAAATASLAAAATASHTPPPTLLKCIQAGLSASSSRVVLSSWVGFLAECLPFYTETIFQVLIPLVETLCNEISSTFAALQDMFQTSCTSTASAETDAPEATLVCLLNALEQLLATAHQRLLAEEARVQVVKSPDQPQGFFGNIFATDTPQTRSATANDRLTVLLAFQDAVRICFRIWSWGKSGGSGSGSVSSSSQTQTQPQNTGSSASAAASIGKNGPRPTHANSRSSRAGRTGRANRAGRPGGRGVAGSEDVLSAASFNYTSLRTRNRARRLLEHLFAAETLECLETVMGIWRTALLADAGAEESGGVGDSDVDAPDVGTGVSVHANAHADVIAFQAFSPSPSDVLELLPTLDGSRPKHTIPAIFHAIYSRTNPAALDPARKSTLTIALQDTDIVAFLVDYARSLEDDTMDEIWQDCTAFLKDILANPFPHRQSLPCLLEFAAILGEKVDNTNFGEQRKMRRELGDLFLRLLTALFTTRPITFSDGTVSKSSLDTDRELVAAPAAVVRTPAERADDVVGILSAIVPNLPKILTENDRVLTAATTISTNVIGPTLRSKGFPETMSRATLVLLEGLSQLPNNQKSWRRDVADAFNDTRFFGANLALVQQHWLGLLRLWAVSDKDRMPELLSRITAPTTAGIVFGVGATSARLEADRRTQLNLRRVAALILAAAPDTFVSDLPTIADKLVELLGASATSSPSSTTRAEVYLVLRTLILRINSIHLAGLWPWIDAELHTAISSIATTTATSSSTSAAATAAMSSSTASLGTAATTLAGAAASSSSSAGAGSGGAVDDTYNTATLLQACKLLDLVVCVAPDDFQLREWLFVTDTIDAIYHPANYQPVALADELSEEMSGGTGVLGSSASGLGLSGDMGIGNGGGRHNQNDTSSSNLLESIDWSRRRPLLASSRSTLGSTGLDGSGKDDVPYFERKDELVNRVLRPFFSQLSIYAFESTYAMGSVDLDGCVQDVLRDLFDERAIVKAL